MSYLNHIQLSAQYESNKIFDISASQQYYYNSFFLTVCMPGTVVQDTNYSILSCFSVVYQFGNCMLDYKTSLVATKAQLDSSTTVHYSYRAQRVA